jgi:hypothetical protein
LKKESGGRKGARQEGYSLNREGHFLQNKATSDPEEWPEVWDLEMLSREGH